jgi:hypothetical protein
MVILNNFSKSLAEAKSFSELAHLLESTHVKVSVWAERRVSSRLIPGIAQVDFIALQAIRLINEAKFELSPQEWKKAIQVRSEINKYYVISDKCIRRSNILAIFCNCIRNIFTLFSGFKDIRKDIRYMWSDCAGDILTGLDLLTSYDEILSFPRYKEDKYKEIFKKDPTKSSDYLLPDLEKEIKLYWSEDDDRFEAY